LEIPSTQALAKELGIDLVEIHRLDKGEFSRNVEDNHFDAILFAEILEHIAFNPLEMWSELFRIIRPGGLIFISTPNSLNLLQTLRGLAGILLRRGQGLSIPSLMSTVTYGHHWKEYSKRELIEYFSYLGLPRNKLEFQYINYSREVTPLALTVFNAVTAITPFWRRDIFLVVEIPETKPNVPPPPGIPAA
jgi:SAM-dependent methyltransferase